jgi:hypothetical protein
MALVLHFLPQFVGADTSDPACAVLARGLAFAAQRFLVKAPVWLYRSSGAVLFGLGASLAPERQR